MKVIKVVQKRLAIFDRTSGHHLIHERTRHKTIVQARQGVPGPQGQKGDKGDQGEPGIPGPVGSDLSYTHTQAVPAAIWTVVHNLGKYPAVTVADSAGSVVVGEIAYQDINTLQLAFSGAFAGMAYLN